MKQRFTEEQIIGVLKEAEAGMKVAEVCHKFGISDATYYNWKSKFGGTTVAEAQRLKALEAEHAKLKKLLAVSMLDNAAKVFSPITTKPATRAGFVVEKNGGGGRDRTGVNGFAGRRCF
jgi:putative transposase